MTSLKIVFTIITYFFQHSLIIMSSWKTSLAVLQILINHGSYKEECFARLFNFHCSPHVCLTKSSCAKNKKQVIQTQIGICNFGAVPESYIGYFRNRIRLRPFCRVQNINEARITETQPSDGIDKASFASPGFTNSCDF